MSHHANPSRQSTIELCKRILDSIENSPFRGRGLHVTAKDFSAIEGLENLRIDFGDLDLATGEHADGSAKFFQPIPPDRVYSLLKQYGMEGCGEPSHPVTSSDYGARGLVADIHDYEDLAVYLSWDDAKFFDKVDKWSEILGSGQKQPYLSDAHDAANGETHSSGVLLSWFMPEDKQLTLVELTYIASITLEKLSEYEFQSHKICPVLILYAAHRSIRIISALVDGDTSTVRVYGTGFVNFDNVDFEITEKGLEQSDKSAQVVGWAYNKPCGNTK
ncbi:hypothetical protein F4810DRAFT_668592 [Camillea tinctor]|nr:hypothetical protein F4810DRAFT_668592 [Camillea tinctor]